MSIRSAAWNLRRARRKASSGVGRRAAASPVSARCSRVGVADGLTAGSLAGSQRRPVVVASPLQCRAVAARDDYPHQLAITTRWKDNDVYGHVNNVEYYSYFDTVINEYLIAEGGLDIFAGTTIGLCAESHCAFQGPLAFPGVVEAGLRVGKLGRSS